MNLPQDKNTELNIKLFDLLLLQFGGSEGELTMAIAYLTQATTDDNAMRKAALVRIAREKIKHADTLGSILLHLNQGRTGPLSTSMSRTELRTLLTVKGLKNNNMERATESLNAFLAAETSPSGERHYASDPKVYLAANIATEERQIAAYGRIAHLTTDSNFVSALNYAKSRQIQHRDEFLDLLRRANSPH
jgi:Mn-containing catalase